MAEAYKKLGQGILSGGVDTLYTVPGSTEAIVKHITLVNYSVSNRTVKLWHDGNADTNYIMPEVTIQAGGWAEFDGVICMEAADTLKADASAATSITYTIHGLEKS